MKRVIITGAGGFCGKQLRSFLISSGVEVHTIGTKFASSHHYCLAYNDITAIVSAIEQIKPEYIFHLAGVGSTSDIALYYAINTLYAANLFGALDRSGYSHCPVLLVGTAAEYGKVREEDIPIKETTKADPINHYGISKLAQTLMGLNLSKSGRPVVIMRPFNIVGPAMPDFFSIQNFIQQIIPILRDDHPPFMKVGNLTSIRDFVSVYDVSKIYWDIIQNPSTYGQVINLCSGKGYKMEIILDKLIELGGKSIEILPDPTRFKPADIPVSIGDPSKLKGFLGYSPSSHIDEVLNQILTEALNH